jgi:hypothetical protein
MVIAVVRGGFNLVQQVQRKGSHCAWERGHRALGDATQRATPARRSGSRRQDAHSACPGCARLRRACQRGYASGVQAGETPALHSGSRARDARAPFRFMGACASGAHISSACPGCARLRRAYQQRLPRVRAPLARISAAPALGARASGAHAGEDMPPAESSRIAPESTRIVPSETRRTRDARALSRLNITPRTHNS